MMKYYTDKQNHVINCLAYADLEVKSWEPGMKLVDLVNDHYKKQLIEAGLEKLEIVDYANNNGTGSYSGFCAIAFRDPETGERGMTFRGTENLEPKKLATESQVDMVDNIYTALLGESVQKQEALEFFEKNKALYGDNYLFGHSKGGELASEVYVENYDEIREMHVLNPQPINPYKLNKKQLEALKNDKVDVVIIDGDIVHSLGAWPYADENTRYIVNNGSDATFVGPHMKESAKIEGDNYEIEDEPFLNYPDQLTFCKVVQPIVTAAQKGYLSNTTYVFLFTLVSVYNLIVRDIPAAIDRFIEAVVSVMEFFIETKEKIEQFISDINSFVQTVVTKVKNWWNSYFNNGYKYAIANSQINVDTYKLKDYAQRLQAINRRISNLDSRLDSLYWRVGLLDLWNLMQADFLTDYSSRLMLCCTYLNNTASDFENAESALIKNL